MIEQFRQMVLKELEAMMKAAADTTLNLQFYGAGTTPTGQTIPGTTAEAIGMQTVTMNARARALWDAGAVVNKAYTDLTAPKQEQAKAANGDAAQKGPYS